MKPDIHPAYDVTSVTCTCGNTFTTRSTAGPADPRRDLLGLPPVLHRQAEILDTGGRVARFEKRFGKRANAGADAAEPSSTSDGARPPPRGGAGAVVVSGTRAQPRSAPP